MKKILFTGGGTAGHITPNLAIMQTLPAHEYSLVYIGQRNSMEERLIREAGYEFHGISAGKFRRQLSMKNFTDLFEIRKGIKEAKELIRRIKPDLVFSKGGFVAYPVVKAAKSCGVPVIVHESDLHMGLSNRISLPHCTTFCCAFEDTLAPLAGKKFRSVCTGIPIRPQLLEGRKQRGLELTGFDQSKPIVLVMGGSSGAVNINNALRGGLPKLLEEFQVVHICGKGNIDDSLRGTCGYVQYDFVTKELPHLYAACDLVVSRAGATAIFEILGLGKPSLLIPLGLAASRGDQIQNAEYFEKRRLVHVLPDDEKLNGNSLFNAINKVKRDAPNIRKALRDFPAASGLEAVLGEMQRLLE
ncbi:MAG: undecaprenyldiphospho-muramoylpentapeptide beta-N-acetylglucosaminyltransferase [Oscillospiraceae bacterium]|nr:undecaprenyldiphospho-muramoylpentapeptide beta-N-acetylglucosaminyltransferase [Oscillospiraceae bacterium]